MATANTLATTAQTLMDQLTNATITFDAYKNSMNTVIAQIGSIDLKNEDVLVAAHTISVAIRIAQGDTPVVPRRK